MDRWDVNAIVLHHRSRFFTAATLAVRALDAAEGAQLALLGNLAWATSSFLADDADEEATMALGGALLGTLGPAAAGGEGAPLAVGLGALEAALDERHDELVAAAWEGLGAAGLIDGSPAAVNGHVWGVLFPRVAYRPTLGGLVQELSRLLREEAAG